MWCHVLCRYVPVLQRNLLTLGSFLHKVCTCLPNYTTRSVWKVASHSEYLENWSCGFDVTWQPVRGTLLQFCEQALSHGASQSAVRRHWLSLCTVWPPHSQLYPLSMANLALGKTRSRRDLVCHFPEEHHLNIHHGENFKSPNGLTAFSWLQLHLPMEVCTLIHCGPS